jgi:hypothetical protein
MLNLENITRPAVWSTDCTRQPADNQAWAPAFAAFVVSHHARWTRAAAGNLPTNLSISAKLIWVWLFWSELKWADQAARTRVSR